MNFVSADKHVFHPFSGKIPESIADSAEGPVSEHADPDRDRAEAKDADQNRGQSNTAAPHDDAAHNHGIADISGRAQAVSGNEGRNPDDRFYDRDPSHHI